MINENDWENMTPREALRLRIKTKVKKKCINHIDEITNKCVEIFLAHEGIWSNRFIKWAKKDLGLSE
jgi:hypothetical protein